MPSYWYVRTTLGVFHISNIFFRHHSHPRRQYRLVLVYYWMYVPFFDSYIEIAISEQTRLLMA
jgi:hypothetical protein